MINQVFLFFNSNQLGSQINQLSWFKFYNKFHKIIVPKEKRFCNINLFSPRNLYEITSISRGVAGSN